MRPPAPLHAAMCGCVPVGDIFIFGWFIMDVKQPSTYAEQLQKLKKRGCIINNDDIAIKVLHHINYYRFTAYFLPFKISEDEYVAGTSFKKVYEIYEFDRSINKANNIENTILKLPEIFTKEEIRINHPFVSESTINRTLSKLRDEKVIKPLGKGRSAKWIKISSEA